MFTSTTKNQIKNGNLTNGANNGAQNQTNNNYADALRERKQMAVNAAASVARDIEGVWGVQWATMAGKISKAMRSKSTGCGVIDCGYAKIDGAGGDNIVYVTVNYSRKRDADGIVSCVITLAAKASSRAEMQYIELPLVYSTTTKNEDKFAETLGAVMIKAILAAYEDDDEIARMTDALRENDRKAADHDAYWAEQTNCARETTSDMLDECGYNALALAKALVCAEKELEHRYCGDAKAVGDVWLAFRDELLRRLASLGNGGGDPAPGCENAAEKSAENNGNPAPGFSGGDDDHDTIDLICADGGVIKLKANTNCWTEGKTYQSNLGEVYVYAGRTANGVMIFRDNDGELCAANDLWNGKAAIHWADCDEIIYLKHRDDGKTNSGNDADTIAELLAADFEKIYYGDCDDLGCYTLGDYILTTTRNDGIESVWMTATLMLTNEAQKQYVLDAHEQWELTWDVEYYDEIDETAQKIADAMITAPRHFFREGADYTGDNGQAYTLESAEWDGYRERYSVTLTDADGEEIDAVMDAEATAVTVYGDEGGVLTVFHAEDVIE